MPLKKITVMLISILGLLLVMTACQTKHSKTQTLTGYDVLKIRRLAVMPFLPGNTALNADAQVRPLVRAAGIYDDLPQNRMVDTPRQLAQRFGKASGADYVVIGSVWRYRDPTPGLGASVAFTAYLLEVDSGRRVWRGRFDKTQQALTDNLQDAGSFFTKEGARWLSAEELARFGIEQVMQSFPETVE